MFVATVVQVVQDHRCVATVDDWMTQPEVCCNGGWPDVRVGLDQLFVATFIDRTIGATSLCRQQLNLEGRWRSVPLADSGGVGFDSSPRATKHVMC